MTRSPRPSPSVFAYCKRSNTGGGNGLGTRLEKASLWAEQEEEHKRQKEEKARLRDEREEEHKRQREEKARLWAEQEQKHERQVEEKARLQDVKGRERRVPGCLRGRGRLPLLPLGITVNFACLSVCVSV